MKVERVRTVALLKACDDFMAVHGPLGGKPPPHCDATWCIRLRGKIVACGCSNWRKWREYHLANAAANVAYSGRGLQRALIVARMAHAKQLGRIARTYTHESNVRSMINLIRCGMFPTLRHDQWVHFTSVSGDPEAT